jgi:hypothetical protein
MILPMALVSLLLTSVRVANAGDAGGRSLRGAQVEPNRAGQTNPVDTATAALSSAVVGSPSQSVLASTAWPKYFLAPSYTATCRPGYEEIMYDAAACQAAAATLGYKYKGSYSWMSIPSGCVYEPEEHWGHLLSGRVWFNSDSQNGHQMALGDYQVVCQLQPMYRMAAPGPSETNTTLHSASQSNNTSSSTLEP